jgi:hypothetical protein
MSKLWSILSPALQDLLELAATTTTGTTAEHLARRMNKSPSTIRNQIWNIRQKAAEVGYETDKSWKRIVIDAEIYCRECNVSRSS